MRARGFSKRIEIWQTFEQDDGYGGHTLIDAQITTTWAKVNTFGNKSSKYSSKLSDFGISDTQTAITVQVRKRSDFDYNSLNQFIMYNGVKYTIATFPTDNNFNHSIIEFIAVREVLKVVTDATPVGVANIVAGYKAVVEAYDGTLSSEACTTAFVTKLNV